MFTYESRFKLYILFHVLFIIFVQTLERLEIPLENSNFCLLLVFRPTLRFALQIMTSTKWGIHFYTVYAIVCETATIFSTNYMLNWTFVFFYSFTSE
jgi:hypothetical protein